MNFKKIHKIILVVLLTVSFILASGIYFTFFRPNVKGEMTYLYVPHNSEYKQVIDSLEKSGCIKSIMSFKIAAKIEHLDKKISPGRYKIEKGMNNLYIIRAIANGWQTPVRLTISGNIRNLEKLASIISKKIESDSSEIISVLRDTCLIDSLGFDPTTFPTMFLPDTYEVFWTVSPKELLFKLKREYDKFWNEERVAKASKIGLTPVEVSILASIVSEESNIKDEQPVIAGVYLNRLKRGMKLQADPTIKFILNDPSIKRILNKHLTIDSPYNTYIHKGLPPGPIVIPQKSTIDAVLNYKQHDYFYFCAAPTLNGSHNFARNITEHNKNARAYQRAISRKN
ncbi:MAG TPA: endolytic transglycosylase MltG [Bacteroidales bacterium]|nr:endolytic transglycosylase MltG [Bacteroidales bacterium]HRT83238.1 endolytic transglycosylase MltG [Bacteroidales bacterium]